VTVPNSRVERGRQFPHGTGRDRPGIILRRRASAGCADTLDGDRLVARVRKPERMRDGGSGPNLAEVMFGGIELDRRWLRRGRLRKTVLRRNNPYTDTN